MPAENASGKPGDTETAEQVGAPERVERAERVGAPERVETAERAERVETAERVEKAERVVQAESAETTKDGDDIEATGATGAAGAVEASGGLEASDDLDGLEAPDDLGDLEAPDDLDGLDDIKVRDAVSAPDAEGKPRRATRRFPLFTRDTARPEGGGRAAPRDAPAPARQWPVLAVLATTGLGLLLTAFDMFRVGILLIGAALLAGGVLRWLLPDVGMLAVRSRFTDIVTYGVLGLVIVLLALMVQPNPWLVIPFLKDTLHLTVSS